MTNRLRSRFRGASTFTAVAAALALAGCNPSGSVDRSQSASLPALPATLPLAPGDATAPGYAPAAALLPATRQIRTVRVADPRDSYAYAEDAWDFADALGDAPPDYGFYYGDAQPWAWQGYDDSITFVEPLDDGYRYYYYRPGADTPYFVRDPYYGYGYDNGRLAVVYGRDGGLVPYADYGPRLDYASRYYVRGRDLYQASRQRRPVIAANWAARRDAIVDAPRWAAARTSQRAWQDYHQRTEAQQAQHWREEQARRRADTVRFAAWQGQDFRTPPPPRAIPAAWTRAKWAKDQNRFAPPAAGFDGDAAARERAAMQERERVVRPARERERQAPGAFVAGPGMQHQQPQPQDRQRADFARQQAERAQQARAVGDQQQAVRERREAARQQQQAQAGQQAAARDAQIRARLQADRAVGEQARQRQAQANERAQAQHAQADMQQRRQEQIRQGREQAQQRQAAAQARQRAEGPARAQEQAIRAQQRQAVQAQQRNQMQAQAQQREAAQAQRRAQGQARAQEQAAQAQQRQAAQSQQRAQMQAQVQQRQAAQMQQRAEMQARQRPASPPPQARAAPAAPPQPAAPRANPGNGGGHKREPH